MTSPLQQLVDNTPVGGRLDLGARRFDIDESVVIRGPITVVGGGASIHLAPSPIRSLPTVQCRGAGIKLHGSVIVFGSKPVGAPYDATLEAQHGIELHGVSNFLLDGWRIENTRGDAFSFGKAGNGDWCRNVTLTNFSSNEIGRQQVSFDAVRTATLSLFNLRASYRSVFDIEPPGGDWGATDVLITQGRIHSSNGNLLSSLGVGTTDSVKNITLSHLTCIDQAVSARISPPVGVRRSNISITDCTSTQTIEQTPIRVNAIDGLLIARNTQPVAHGTAPVSAVDCTSVNITDNVFAPTTTPPRIV